LKQFFRVSLEFYKFKFHTRLDKNRNNYSKFQGENKLQISSKNNKKLEEKTLLLVYILVQIRQACLKIIF